MNAFKTIITLCKYIMANLDRIIITLEIITISILVLIIKHTQLRKRIRIILDLINQHLIINILLIPCIIALS